MNTEIQRPKRWHINLAFTLSMPNRGSWNGGWSGAENLYVIVKKFSTIKARAKAENILAAGSFYYNFGDGWGASIGVKSVDNKEARRLKTKSAGFCGYDWMVTSILEHGEI